MVNSYRRSLDSGIIKIKVILGVSPVALWISIIIKIVGKYFPGS